ncbi:Gfo/Idh/MocA family oxidoreductase (plasmid) [Bradyrhizobium barranii subsp. barranii]|uniref:Gfo/Idh/MocA family oxidoreductase n=1 Tax=Bradyrhizobium barranii subsp. barranii TaxID=2823807 RepID=A0A7Z0TX63_9BRAD|nr:Gfo/Idh/MocA family oxidoreductase [Bradyrhizobium barranii]UGX89737.1 Gfo/Idh/MocA family oxidoreductase [Bradyrhizobium barranii subsp. barranii]
MSRSIVLRSKPLPPLLNTQNQTENAAVQSAKNGPLLAIIGCGYWGAKHIRVACDIRDARMSMAADLSPDRLEYIHSQYPSVAVSRDFGAVLNNPSIDGVIVATPVETHFELARAVLQAGKHALVEKPLAMTSAQCRELNAIAEERKRVLMVGHTFEYHPAVGFIRQMIQSGSLGELYYIDSRRLNLGLYRQDANVLWDLAPHDLSIIFFLLEEVAQTIGAWGCAHVLPDVEDVVYAKMGFKSGATAHVHVSWLDPVKVRQITIVGSDAMLVFDDVQPSEKVRVYQKRFRPRIDGDSYADFQSAYHHGDVHIPAISNSEPLKLEILDFVNAMKTGERPRADGVHGLRVVEALEAASACLRLKHKHRGNVKDQLTFRRRNVSVGGPGIAVT